MVASAARSKEGSGRASRPGSRRRHAFCPLFLLQTGNSPSLPQRPTLCPISQTESHESLYPKWRLAKQVSKFPALTVGKARTKGGGNHCSRQQLCPCCPCLDLEQAAHDFLSWAQAHLRTPCLPTQPGSQRIILAWVLD